MAYISDAVRNEDCSCCAALLGGAVNVIHASTNYQTDNRSKESNHSVASYGCGSVMSPAASPYHGAPCNNRQVAKDEKNEADVRYLAGKVARKQDEDEANAAEGKLEEYRVKSRPAVAVLISKNMRNLSSS